MKKFTEQIKKFLEDNIEIVLINVNVSDEFPIIRVFFDGVILVKGVFNNDNTQVQLIYDDFNHKTNPARVYNVDSLGKYILTEYLKKYPHHKKGFQENLPNFVHNLLS